MKRNRQELGRACQLPKGYRLQPEEGSKTGWRAGRNQPNSDGNPRAESVEDVLQYIIADYVGILFVSQDLIELRIRYVYNKFGKRVVDETPGSDQKT